jgi:catechol 2,3-dioxygenase-like lactoylglutathione lyase family enzyme
MPRLTAILETVLYVAEIPRAARFYETVMQLPILHADDRMRTYDVNGRGTLLLFIRGGTLDPVTTPGGTIPPHDGSGPLHIAFAIEKAELAAWEDHLAAQGIAVASRIDWSRGGRSIYFRDPDDHLLELATPGLWKGY